MLGGAGWGDAGGGVGGGGCQWRVLVVKANDLIAEG